MLVKVPDKKRTRKVIEKSRASEVTEAREESSGKAWSARPNATQTEQHGLKNGCSRQIGGTPTEEI